MTALWSRRPWLDLMNLLGVVEWRLLMAAKLMVVELANAAYNELDYDLTLLILLSMVDLST